MPRPSTYIKRYNAPISGQEALFDTSYRFTFNGKEIDSEVKGEGNSLDFGARMYDSRLGRFLSVDPAINLTHYYSPYLFAGNSPIIYIDYDGQCKIVVSREAQNAGVTVQTITRFENIVANLVTLLTDNPAILNKIAEQTGWTKEQVLAALKYDGSGPVIRIDVNIDHNRKGGGPGFRFDQSSNEIWVEADMVIMLSNLSNSDKYFEANLFATMLALTHEMTHKGDYDKNNRLTDGKTDLGAQNTKSEKGHRGIDITELIIGLDPATTGVSAEAPASAFSDDDLRKIEGRLKKGTLLGNIYRPKYENTLSKIKGDEKIKSKAGFEN